jgi:predicted nucleic acid-binding protein
LPFGGNYRGVRGRGELFHAEASLAISPDPGDTKFLDCAKTARADFIITGNKRHFPDAPCGPAQVVSAGELLDRITREI